MLDPGQFVIRQLASAIDVEGPVTPFGNGPRCTLDFSRLLHIGGHCGSTNGEPDPEWKSLSEPLLASPNSILPTQNSGRSMPTLQNTNAPGSSPIGSVQRRKM